MIDGPVLPDALGRLERIVGAAHLLRDEQLTRSYTTDWTRRWSGPAAAVVRPGTTEEVAAVLRTCSDARIAVVPQGGNTGLVGGGVPRGGEVVLSTTRLADVGPVEPAARTVTVGAGAALSAVQSAAATAGLRFGVDLAARDSATIGGMAATNAGGVHVVAHGPMADSVRGLEVALSDGSVVRRLSGLAKDTAGYDLPRLLVGSEGTLGVITQVALRLVGPLRNRVVALLALERVGEAVALAATLPDQLPVQAVELMLHDGFELTCAHARLARPFGRAFPVYLLVEVGGAEDPTAALAAAIDAHQVAEVAVAGDAAGRTRLWAYRERHTEAVSALGVPRKFDLGLPLDRVDPFLSELPALLRRRLPGARVFTWGHLAEGNLHVNVVPGPMPGLAPAPGPPLLWGSLLKEPPAEKRGVVPGPVDDAIDELVLGLATAHGGTISAEHGVGVAKARWLHLVRDAADIAAMRAIKRALDPHGTLNPGVLLDAAHR